MNILVQRLVISNSFSFQGLLKVSDLQTIRVTSQRYKQNQLWDFIEKESEPKVIHEIANIVLRNPETYLGPLTFGIILPDEQLLTYHPIKVSLLDDEQPRDDNNSIGMLYLTGSEQWIPLDGYHRFYGFLEALSRTSGKQKKIFEQVDIPVVLIPLHRTDDIKGIIRRLHKSVRSVDKGEAIRHALDDISAIYADWLMGKDEAHHIKVLDESLVNWKSNTLTNRLQKFTTLSVLYDSIKILVPSIEKISIEDEATMTKQYEHVAMVWKTLIETFIPFKKAYNSPITIPHLRELNMCLRATGQLVVIKTIQLGLKQDMPLQDIIDSLNKLPWAMKDKLWDKIVVVDGRITGSNRAITLTSNFIAYYINIPQSAHDRHILQEEYQKAKGSTLPQPLWFDTVE